MTAYNIKDLKFITENWDTCFKDCWCCRTDCIMHGGCIKEKKKVKKKNE